jgi:diacylglycerol kinase family enzyme
LCSNVVLGVLPAGGGNDLAASLGLSRDAVTAAKQLLQGVPCPLDAVQVRTSEGFERYYVGGGGLGLDAEASRYARSAYCNVGGRRRYVLSAIRALIHFHSVQVRVEFENGDAAILCESALLLGILNTPSYGAGVRLAPEARTDDGELDLVLLEKLGFFEVLAMLPALIMTGTVRAKRLQRKKVKCVRIETDRPCNFHGDGEILGTTPVEIEVVPRAVLVLRPRPAVGSV